MVPSPLCPLQPCNDVEKEIGEPALLEVLHFLQEERAATLKRHEDVLGALRSNTDLISVSFYGLRDEVCQIRDDLQHVPSYPTHKEAPAEKRHKGEKESVADGKIRHKGEKTSVADGKIRHKGERGSVADGKISKTGHAMNPESLEENYMHARHWESRMSERLDESDNESEWASVVADNAALDPEAKPSTRRGSIFPDLSWFLQNSTLHVSHKGVVRVSVVKSLGELRSEGWRHLFRHLVKHMAFEYLFAAVIFANAIIICLEVQHEGYLIGASMQYRDYPTDKSKVWPHAKEVFDAFAWIFGILLCIETAIRMIGLGINYFRDAWDLADLICVVAFLIDKAANHIFANSKNMFQLMRLLRLIRLLKLMRTLEGWDVLYLITTALRGLRSIVGWAIALLTLMLTACALLLSQILHAVYFDGLTHDGAAAEVLEAQARMYEHFGTFTRCIFSLFELTLANYPPVARLLSEEVSEWFFFICLLHKLTIGLAVIGVINGVILQETFKVAASDNLIMLRQKKRAASVLQSKLSGLFKALDQNGDGSLDYHEFEVIAERPDVKYWLASLDIETDDLRTLFILADADDSGSISIDELTARIPRLQGTARSIDLLALLRRLKDESRNMKELIRGDTSFFSQ